MASDADISGLKDIPGYKAILKAVLKTQIQGLVEQLALHTNEESVLITANVSDGSLSHLGSKSGKTFLSLNEDVKSQFLGFCIKMHHQQAVIDTNIEQTLDLLKSSTSNKMQSRRPGVRQRPVPYSIPNRSASVSAVKSTTTCSSQENLPVSHTERENSTETFVVKREPSSDDDESVGAIVYKSESMEMDSTRSASINALSDNTSVSGANWIEPAGDLLDSKAESGQNLNITQNSTTDALTDADQREIDELLANRSDVRNASDNTIRRANDNSTVHDSKIGDTFQEPGPTKDGQVEHNEESQNTCDKAELKEQNVHGEGNKTGQDSISDSPMEDNRSETESTKYHSELPKLDESLNESNKTMPAYTATNELVEDKDDTCDDIDVEDADVMDTKKEITSDMNNDSKHIKDPGGPVAKSEITKKVSNDITGQKISDVNEACGLNPADNESSSKGTDTEKSDKSDDSQDKHYKVLAIWNEIADDSNDASSEVLYDLISEKLKHGSDEKTSVEESSQTDSDLNNENNESTKLEPKTSEAEKSVQKNNSESITTTDSQRDEIDGSKSDCVTSRDDDISSLNSNGSQSTDNVNVAEKELKEVKNISDHQQTVTCAKNVVAKKTNEQLIEDNSGRVKENDANVPAVLSGKRTQVEKLSSNKQSDVGPKPPDAIVIDLENSDTVSSRCPKPKNEIKTPVKQIHRKTSSEKQSPSISPKTGAGNQSTPGKQNFIDNLISKGVPIIIPDEDDDVMPSPRSTAFKSKSKQYNDQKAGTKSPKLKQKVNFPMYSVSASSVQQYSPQLSGTVSSFSQQSMYSVSQPLPDINKNQTSQFSTRGINQPISSRNQSQNYHKQSSPQRYSGQSPSQQYMGRSPSQQFMGQSPKQSYYVSQQNDVRQAFSPLFSQLRQRLFSPPKNVQVVTPADENRTFAGSSNELMSPRQTFPMRQSFSPPVTPTKPRGNIPNLPTYTEAVNRIQSITSVSGQKTASQPKVRAPSQDQTPRISAGTTIIIDDEPAPKKHALTNKQHQKEKADVTQVVPPQQVLMESIPVPKSLPVQAESTSLPVITNVTSLPMLPDGGNPGTSEALSQALSQQQVVFVPVEVISQTLPTSIQDANEKTPIKRERSVDSVMSPSETLEPPSKRLQLSDMKTGVSETASRPTSPSKTLSTQPDMEESVCKITPKVEIDIDEVGIPLSPVLKSPSSTSADPEPTSQDYDNAITSSLHLKSDLKSFSPPISPSTRRMRPDNKKKTHKLSSGSKKSSIAQEESQEATTSKSKQKDFGCGDCGKSYKTKTALNQHFKKHTQDRPFECDVCGKHFSQKAYLKKHIYTHFKENE